MPIYEFLCKECRKEFKMLRSAERLNDIACPTCGTPKVSRLLSVTAQTAPADDKGCALPMGGCCRMNPEACGCRN